MIDPVKRRLNLADSAKVVGSSGGSQQRIAGLK